jgi:hypothetical protein
MGKRYDSDYAFLFLRSQIHDSEEGRVEKAHTGLNVDHQVLLTDDTGTKGLN